MKVATDLRKWLIFFYQKNLKGDDPPFLPPDSNTLVRTVKPGAIGKYSDYQEYVAIDRLRVRCGQGIFFC
jgi:hypothetical protein